MINIILIAQINKRFRTNCTSFKIVAKTLNGTTVRLKSWVSQNKH